MKKIVFYTLLSSLIFLSQQLQAQAYKTSAGIRAGDPTGLSVKHFISGADAIEGIVAWRWRGLQATALYERHATAFNVEQLNWYYGAGAHVGFFDGYKDHPFFDKEDYNKSYVVIGVDGILGLEYDIREIPLTVSLDWKPEINIIGYSGTWLGGGGLSVRYYW